MSQAKPNAEKRRAMALQQKLGWRVMMVAAGGWFLAILSHPMGSMAAFKFASSGTRLTISYGLAAISLAAALVALAVFRPWRRRTGRTWAILLILAALILGDIYILSWTWRL